jgi:hypothetical protein
MEQKGTRCNPCCFITVHEGAGDECAHEQLRADRFHLRYKDTSTPVSNETTRTLPRTESLVSARLESLFRPTLELLFNVVDENGGDGLVAEWPSLAERRTRGVVMPSSDRYEAFVSTVLGKGLPFYGRRVAATVI